MLFLPLFVACNQKQTSGLEGYTDGESYYVVVEPTPNPIPFNEYFSLNVAVYDDDSLTDFSADITVSVDATMPAHGHGMNEDPIVSGPVDGIFLAEGLKWFMEGEWELAVYVNGETNENISFLVDCCTE